MTSDMFLKLCHNLDQSKGVYLPNILNGNIFDCNFKILLDNVMEISINIAL
jgi:hypothetical protein